MSCDIRADIWDPQGSNKEKKKILQRTRENFINNVRYYVTHVPVSAAVQETEGRHQERM